MVDERQLTPNNQLNREADGDEMPVASKEVLAARARLAPQAPTVRQAGGGTAQVTHRNTREGVPTEQGQLTVDERPRIDIRSMKATPSVLRDDLGQPILDRAGKEQIENPPELKRSVPTKYEADAQYIVRFAKNVEVLGVLMSPAEEVSLSGAMCTEHKDAIYAARKAS